MMSASKAVLIDAMREDFEQLPPDARAKLLDMLCASGVESVSYTHLTLPTTSRV